MPECPRARRCARLRSAGAAALMGTSSRHRILRSDWSLSASAAHGSPADAMMTAGSPSRLNGVCGNNGFSFEMGVHTAWIVSMASTGFSRREKDSACSPGLIVRNSKFCKRHVFFPPKTWRSRFPSSATNMVSEPDPLPRSRSRNLYEPAGPAKGTRTSPALSMRASAFPPDASGTPSSLAPSHWATVSTSRVSPYDASHASAQAALQVASTAKHVVHCFTVLSYETPAQM